MKKTILMLLLILPVLFVTAQEKQRSDTLNIDLDKDLKTDYVIFDRANAVIIVKLSGSKFKPMQSEELEFDPIAAEIRIKRAGFEFANSWMRSGYACQFRYNPTQKKMQLIGISRYEFGPANNDGSGKSSINLLTNNYIGNWNYWDERKGQLIAIPAIKRKFIIQATYLDNFSGAVSKYEDFCSRTFNQTKSSILKQKKL